MQQIKNPQHSPFSILNSKFPILLLTLIGAGLRIYQLTARSLWTDESITLIRIDHTWGDILRNHVYLLGLQTTDTNPFAYFIGLKLWALGAGHSEFALKLFSAWLGVLMIPLTYTLGRRLVGHNAALLAALFVLLSPGIEWYSHEMRMYTFVGCVSAINGIIFWKFSIKNGKLKIPLLSFALLILIFLLSIASHYTFIGQVAAFGGLMGFVALSQRRQTHWQLTPQQRRVGLMAFAAIVILVAALATSTEFGNLLQRLATGQEPDYFFVPIHMMWNSIINGFIFGLNAADPSGGWFGWGLCALAAWAFIQNIWRVGFSSPPTPRQLNAWILLCGGVMPVLAWFCISLIKSNFQGLRHMFLVLPYVAIALAGWLLPKQKSSISCLCENNKLSISSPSPRFRYLNTFNNKKAEIRSGRIFISCIIIFATLSGQIYGLNGMFTPSEHWHDDWRLLANTIRDRWLDGDVLLLNSQTVHGAFNLYAPGLTWEMSPSVQNNNRDVVDEAKLTELLKRHPRLWFVHETPNSKISTWLNQHAFVHDRLTFPARNTILLAELYDTNPPILQPTSSVGNRRNIAPQNIPVQWIGDQLQPNPHSPSEQPNVHLRLFLQRNNGPLPQNYAISYRLVYAGQTWLNWDQPIDLSLAPAPWREGPLHEGTIYSVDVAMPVPLGLPLLPYQLQVNARSGGQTLQSYEERLPPQGIANVFRITNWPNLPARSQRWPLAWPPLTDVQLITAEYPNSLKPGDYLPLALTWRSSTSDFAAWTTSVQLDALPLGNVATASKPLAAAGPFAADMTTMQPNLAAQAQQPMRDLLSLQVPPSAKAGWYRLSLSRQRGGQNIDSHWLGLVQVQDYAAAPLPPPAKFAINASAGELSLLGFNLDTPADNIRPGTALNFSTHWQVNAAPTRDGVLFLHILGPDGNLAAQHDSLPIYNNDTRPTQTYRAGEGIVQPQAITLKPDAPKGDYRVLAGVYNREGGQRWPAHINNTPAQDDLIELMRFTIR